MSLLALVLGACQPSTTTPGRSPGQSPSPTRPSLTACPLGPTPPGRQVLLKNLPAPDDLAFNNDGRLLFSDNQAGTVSILNPDGSVQQLATGLSVPEGIVVQADGRILVAEQGRNRISAIDPQTHAVTVWHSFVNRTASEGIDGIGPILPEKDSNGQLLPNADEVVVPDSPNGVVWEVTPDGKSATQIAHGMTRPVGAAIDATSRIFVADEGGAVWVLAGAGKVRFSTLPTPDDVLVGRDGHVVVNTLGDNAIHELDALGREISVYSGISQPQGIALDDADNLYYTVSAGGEIARIVRSFILDPPKVTRVNGDRYIVCPTIRRAAGYTRALGLRLGSGAKATILQIVQPGTDSSGALEVQTSEPSISLTIEGAKPDQLPMAQSQTVALSA